MGATNNKGQILIEVGVVMLAFALIGFAALHELSTQQKSYQKYQFTKEKTHAQKSSYARKK